MPARCPAASGGSSARTARRRFGQRTPLGGGQPALALRLIVQRKPPQAAEATRLALHRAAARKGKALDPRSLIAADFMILATSLPRNGYTVPA